MPIFDLEKCKRCAWNNVKGDTRREAMTKHTYPVEPSKANQHHRLTMTRRKRFRLSVVSCTVPHWFYKEPIGDMCQNFKEMPVVRCPSDGRCIYRDTEGLCQKDVIYGVECIVNCHLGSSIKLRSFRGASVIDKIFGSGTSDYLYRKIAGSVDFNELTYLQMKVMGVAPNV